MAEKIKHVLAVEDEKIYRAVFAHKFTKSGFKLTEAANGQEGLDMAIANHPDIILLDINMPVMDGLTMLKKLRNDEWGREVPVILLTNLTDLLKISEAARMDATDYIIKAECKIEDLVNKVREILEM